MPLYEYQCNDCGTVSEEIQRMSDPPLTTCRECGGHLKKLLSAPAFQFKGTGWYVTDYADKGSDGKPKDADKSADSGGSEKKDSGKSDSGKKESGGSDSGSSSSGESSKSTESSKKSSGKTKAERTSSKD